MGSKYPEYFNVMVPKLDPDGSIMLDGDKQIIFKEEFGTLICWHIAHRDYWKKGRTTRTTLIPISEESKDADPASNKREYMQIKSKSKKKRKSKWGEDLIIYIEYLHSGTKQYIVTFNLTLMYHFEGIKHELHQWDTIIGFA